MDATKEQLYQSALMNIGSAFRDVCHILERKQLDLIDRRELDKIRNRANHSMLEVGRILQIDIQGSKI